MGEEKTVYANNVFEQPWWLDIVAQGAWQEVVVEEAGEVVGRLPFCTRNNMIELPALTQTCGIWIKETEQGINDSLSREKKIIFELMDQLPRFKSFKVAFDTSRQYFLPFLWKGFKVSPRVSYRISDLTDLEKTYSNFSKTVKKNIKSAQKKVEITTVSDVDVLLDIMDKTFAVQGRKYPVSKEIIRRIVEECDRRGNGKMYTAVDKQGNVHACSYFVYDENVFYYLIAGSDSEYRSSGAQTLILWEAIQYASQVSKIFDFEGSMVEGIETFFRRFGGDPVVYYEISQESFLKEMLTVMKPRIKKMLGYKV